MSVFRDRVLRKLYDTDDPYRTTLSLMTRKERLEAYRSPCWDCGVDTTPRPDESSATSREWYMVHDDVWEQAGMLEVRFGYGYLCIGCLEARLGRKLVPQDFTDAPVNTPMLRQSARLRSRITGSEEVLMWSVE